MSGHPTTPKPITPSSRRPFRTPIKDPMSYTKALQSLNYGNSSRDRDADGRSKEEQLNFVEALRNHIRAYKTDKNLEGITLSWASHQSEFERITDAFLVGDEKGILYWPDEEKTKYFSSLQWSNHRDKITKTMKQIFCHVYRSLTKPDGKSQQNPGDVARRMGDDSEAPIDVGGLPDTGRSSCSEDSDDARNNRNRIPRPSSRPIAQHAPREAQPPRSNLTRISTGFGGESSLQRRDSPAVDPYEGPFSPVEAPARLVDKGKRPAEPYQSEESWRAKRARNENGQQLTENAGQQNEVSTNASSWAGDKPGLPSSRVRDRAVHPTDERTENVPEPISTLAADVDAILKDHEEIMSRESFKSPAPYWREGTTDTIGRPPRTWAPTAPMGPFGKPEYLYPEAIRSHPETGSPSINQSTQNNTVVQAEEPVRLQIATAPETPTRNHNTDNSRPPPPPFDGPGQAHHFEQVQSFAPLQSLEIAGERRVVEELRPNALPNINLKISVRESRKMCKRWHLEGTFLQHSLRELVSALPFDDTLRGLKFYLETPDVTFDDWVLLGDEDAFSAIKTRFQRKIQNYISTHERQEAAPGSYFEIMIAPLGRYEEEEDDDDDPAIF